MKNAFCIFVYGDYDRFIPYYVYTINRTYPNCDTVVFHYTKLSSKVKTYLTQNKKVVIYENAMNHIDWIHTVKHRGAIKQSLRHMLPGTYFKNYEHVYFGDVDVLLLNEPVDLFDFHKKQLEQSQLPFSNRVRRLVEGGLSKRLTGLHFVKVKPYYSAMDPIIDKVVSDKTYRNKVLEGVVRNEEFLFNLNMEAFNFNPYELVKNKTPLHGFHIGVFRRGSYIPMNEIRDNCLLDYNEIRSQFVKLMQESQFVNIVNTFYSYEIYQTLTYFGIIIPIQFKINHTLRNVYFNSFIKKIVLKLKSEFNKISN